MTTTPRRPGLSLTEVLVTLFIMAIGAISVLVLFPLGALNMAAALKDDRTSQAATQSDAFLRYYWAADVAGNPANPDPFTAAFTNPGGGAPALTAAANGGEPSYPVFLDPMGVAARGGTTPVAGVAGLARRNLSPVTNPATGQRTALSAPQGLRTCSLLDAMTFDPTQGGQPLDANGNNEREYRYNWLWVLQQPRVADPNTATLTVVVFDQRTHMLTSNEAGLATTFTTGQTAVSVAATPGVVLAKGGWVMDAGNSAIRQAQFYRIVSVTENGTNLDLELDRPVRRVDGQSGQYPGTLVVLAGVSEVFERPNLTP